MPATSDPSAALHADAAALHQAINRLVRLYQFRDRDRICCHDVSVTQCNALEVLVTRGAQRSQALADALLLDKSTTTRVVDALVRKGYVERGTDPEDARAVALSATGAGRALYRRIHRELIAQQADMLRDLDPRVRTAVTEVVLRLARAAESRLVGADGSNCAPACTAPPSCG